MEKSSADFVLHLSPELTALMARWGKVTANLKELIAGGVITESHNGWHAIYSQDGEIEEIVPEADYQECWPEYAGRDWGHRVINLAEEL